MIYEEIYKIVKPISVETLNKAGACREELYAFAFYAMKKGFKYAEHIDDIELVLDCANEDEDNMDWLLDEGFIRYNDPSYKIGDRFLNEINKEGILAQVEPHMVCMICLESGNRHKNPIHVKNALRITQDEFEKITGGGHYEKIFTLEDEDVYP